MKKLLTLTLAMFLYFVGYSQSWLMNLENKDSKDLTFFDYQNAFNDYYKDKNVDKGYYVVKGEKIKAPGWKQFKRWEWNMEMRVNPVTGDFPETNTPIEWKKYLMSNPNAKSSNGNWVQMGPGESDGGYAGIGRINCITFHPTDPNTYWVGSPSGGLWKTTNDGGSWAVLTDQNDVLGVSDIAIPSDFASSNTIYIATGDRDGGSSWSLGGGNYDDNASIGVLKSTDGGVTWNPTALSWTVNQAQQIGRLLIHPTNPQILIAGAYDGIYKTTNGGTSWTKVYSSNYVIDMEFKPGDPTTVYASTQKTNGPQIIKSENTGDTWTTAHTFGTGASRTDLAVTEAAPNHLYVLVSNTSGGLFGVYKSNNSASSFVETFNGSATNHSLLGYYSNGSGENKGQGNYDLALAVAPNDTNIMFLGGINTWKSTDGGYNWTINNMWTSYSGYNFSGAPEVHADKHTLKFYNSTTLFEGNDGGIYKSINTGSSWVDKTNGVIISQLYRIGSAQQSNSIIIAGLQDNGTKVFWTGTWYDVKGGDGMECIIDPLDNNVQYGTYVYGEIERTLDGWSNRSVISDNISDDNGGSWVTPYVLDPNNNQTLYVGYADIWKSTNRGNSFTKISAMNSSQKFRSLAVAPGNSSVIYAADQTHIWKTTSGGSSWTNITGTLPVSSSSITYVTVHNSDPDIVWVTFGGYNSNRIYESTNGGTTWTSISAGLPSLPVFCVVQNKFETSKNQIYVGTDRGVFVKNGTENWAQFNTGLPNVMVTELDIYYNNSTPVNSRIRAATYGRGLWESDLLEFTVSEIVTGNITESYTVTPNTSTSIDVDYTVNTTFSSNTFTAYLSDENGDFTSEAAIGTLSSDLSGTINATIPANTPSGTGYKIRVKSSNPLYTSPSSNAFQIELLDEIVAGTIYGSYNVTSSAGAAISIPFTINTAFTSNTFTAYLSNASSDFTGETAIGNLVSNAAGSISGTIPENTPTGSGYKVRVKSSSPEYTGTSSNAFQITLNTSTDIIKFDKNLVKIYPMPAAGDLNIEFEKPEINVYVQLTDISGKIVYTKEYGEISKDIISTKAFIPGIYLMQIKVGSRINTIRIIIQ